MDLIVPTYHNSIEEFSMPFYTYHCENCDHEFEKYQSFAEESLTTCPNCAEESLRKVYKPALVVFKGKGFYVTDSKSASSTLTSNSHNDSNGSEETKSESKKKDPKPEAPPKKEKS
ncbi:MAG: zinc ribbon domain-containing protein [Anaerolineales bacterium]|jgi:putative FmdB family regulatory protein